MCNHMEVQSKYTKLEKSTQPILECKNHQIVCIRTFPSIAQLNNLAGQALPLHSYYLISENSITWTPYILSHILNSPMLMVVSQPRTRVPNMRCYNIFYGAIRFAPNSSKPEPINMASTWVSWIQPTLAKRPKPNLESLSCSSLHIGLVLGQEIPTPPKVQQHLVQGLRRFSRHV